MIAIVDFEPGNPPSDELRIILNRIIGESTKSLTDFQVTMENFLIRNLTRNWSIGSSGHHIWLENNSTGAIIRVVDLNDPGLSLSGLSTDLSDEKDHRSN